MTPTQLSLRKMREEGYMSAVVEKWNPHVGIRQDLFGFIDILGVGENGTLAVQSTSYDGVSARVKKIEHEDNFDKLNAVRKAGWKIEVHGWRKVKNKWEARVVDLS